MALLSRPSRLLLLLLVLLALLLSACSTAKVRYGPFTIPASPNPGDMDQAGELNTRLTNIQKPCTNCSILGLRPAVTYADGSEANWNTDVMLHHAVWFNTSRSDLTCQGWPQRFFASGNERTDGRLLDGYGYKVNSGDNWSLLVDLMNMSGQPQTVYLDLSVLYRDPTGQQNVTPVWLDINNCGNSEYTIPAGFSDTHRDFTAPWNGKFVSIGGHVHDDGLYTELTNQTTGQSICKSTAGYGTKPAYMGHIESMTGCLADPVATFQQGDALRLHSVYDSPTTQNDVMGIMLGYAVPSG
jgi:hypothetical protein